MATAINNFPTAAMETKWQTRAACWLDGYMSKSGTVDFGCCLGCTLALLMTTMPLRQHVWQC